MATERVSGTWDGQDVPDIYRLLDRPAWHRFAACHGMSRFMFPEKGESANPARSICAACPVRAPCREAGANERFGWWGGLPAGRRRQRGRRPSAA